MLATITTSAPIRFGVLVSRAVLWTGKYEVKKRAVKGFLD